MREFSLITIIDVMRARNVEPTSELTWAVGAEVRDEWERRHGALPDKDLRRKTNGGGTHCFAVYPVTFWPVIEGIILAFQMRQQTEALQQMELPFFS